MIWIGLIFGLGVFGLSWLIAGKQKRLERAEMAFYIVLIAWGALLTGLTFFQHRVS